MKRLSNLLILFLIPIAGIVSLARPARAQLPVTDVGNLTQAVAQVFQLKQQLRQLRESYQLAQEVRDAAKDARRLRNQIGRRVDQIRGLRENPRTALDAALAPLRGDGVVSYQDSHAEWVNRWAMNDAPSDPTTYARTVNDDMMRTVSATLQSLKVYEDNVLETSRKLAQLQSVLGGTRDPEQRAVLQSDLLALQTQLQAQQQQLSITRTSLDAVLEARQIDAQAQANRFINAELDGLIRDLERESTKKPKSQKRNLLAPRN